MNNENQPSPAKIEFYGYALPSGYTLNEAQALSLERVAKRWEVSPFALLDGASQGFGNPETAELLINPKGQIWLGIERDGYCHS